MAQASTGPPGCTSPRELTIDDKKYIVKNQFLGFQIHLSGQELWFILF